MQFGKRVHAERFLAFEITPMIDVVFLLIIFFMTTARFAQVTRAQLDLPKEQGEQQETPEEAGIIINIDAAGELVVGQNVVTLDELEQIVLEEVARLRGRDAEKLKLMIRADQNGPTDRLNQVVARLQRIGVGAARLATEIPR
jgi:biopolymer transport protein ExbD